MERWWQRFTGQARLSVQEDPYGFSVDGKPRVPLQGLFERLVSKISMPADQQQMLEEASRQGTVVYAIKYRSQVDFVCFALRLYQLGLPAPSFLFEVHPYLWQPRWYALRALAHHAFHGLRQGALPDPFGSGYYRQKIESGEAGLLFLLGERGYYRRTVRVGHDPLEHLLDLQKDSEKPIFLVPGMVLYSRRPDKEKGGLLEALLGQREYPGTFRKFLSFWGGYADAVLEVGEPLNLREVLPELSENVIERRNQVFQVRRNLIDSIDSMKRAIVGPSIRSNLEMKEIILHHPRLEAYTQRRAKTQQIEAWKVRMEADGYLDEIAASYSYTLVHFGARTLQWMWSNLFDGIDLDMESLQRVKQAARHNTLVYIPCHKSHIDYLILSYLLFQNNLSPPFIAAGKNLAFWPLGPIFRRGGAFFIRRSFRGMKFYTEVFTLYVKTMVQLGHNLEFFIEGGRSRTGKMVLPKMGLLGVIIQAVEEGFCDDLVFVPTSICYDRIPEEEAYMKEISGGAKVDENLGQLMRARRFLKRRYGRVYVQFGEPMSVQRHLERYRDGSAKLRPRERHAMYRDFAYRIINKINQASLVTPHSLAAAALLTTSRRGISLAEFHETCKLFFDYLCERGVRFSDTMRSYQACMEETLSDLERSKLISKLRDEDDDLEEEVFSMDDSKRLTLEYYKNNLIHFLLPAAYISTSILAQETFRFSVSQILEDVAFLTNFYKFEFVYDNEISQEKLVEDVLGTFESMGWLQRVEDEDRPFLLAHKGLRAANAFHGLLRNYLEGYWLVLRALRYLQKKPYSERDFLKKVLSLGQKGLKLELIERPEAVSNIIFANALKYFVEKGVVEKRAEEDKSKDKGQEWYTGVGNRALIHYYSKQISRFLRSPHIVLQ